VSIAVLTRMLEWVSSFGLPCLGGAKRQQRSAEDSSEEWAACDEEQLRPYRQAGREPDEGCPEG
jgi:hypothetical protein